MHRRAPAPAPRKGPTAAFGSEARKGAAADALKSFKKPSTLPSSSASAAAAAERRKRNAANMPAAVKKSKSEGEENASVAFAPMQHSSITMRAAKKPPTLARPPAKPVLATKATAGRPGSKVSTSRPVTTSKSSSGVGTDARADALHASLKEQQEDNARLTQDVEQLQAARFAAEKQLAYEQSLLAELQSEYDAREREVVGLQAELGEAAQRAIDQQASAADALALCESRVRDAEETIEQLKARALAAESEASALHAENERKQALLDDLVERSLAQEALRRQMHEALQTYRGNIRVYCRIRPSAPGSATVLRAGKGSLGGGLLDLMPPGSSDDSSALSSRSSKADGRKCPPHQFQFDHIFDGSSSQSDVFREVSQLTQSALDGHSVCIFAYGQTGSGKTYSMAGPSLDAQNGGVVPRAVSQAFARARELNDLGWHFEFAASFLEIYNEELHDLNPTVPRGDKLKIVDINGTVSVPGLCAAAVASASEVHALLEAAAKMRATCATACNAHSSRSHYIFRLSIRGRNGAESLEGELNLVDLAGSERIKESQVSGTALAEAKAINKSLSSLGDVVASLASNAKHVPFRNSKLTHLLQNALSGSSKTLMFVNVSPLERHHNETLSSLRFAQKANGCQFSQKGRGKP